jgi:hypothetical protein
MYSIEVVEVVNLIDPFGEAGLEAENYLARRHSGMRSCWRVAFHHLTSIERN